MNKWLYRTVGAVGVASSALLLSNGAAHAQAANDAKPNVDPQAMRGLVADLFKPTGGLHNLGLSELSDREEFVGGLLGGGAGGNPLGGITGGLTGAGNNGLLSGLTGGLTGGEGGTGLLSGLTGGEGPVGSLTGSLTGGLGGGDGGSPLGGLTGGLTDGLTSGGLASGLTGGEGPLGSLTGGLTGGDGAGKGPLGGLTGGLTSGLTGGEGPLGGLTGGSPLGGLTGGITGPLTGRQGTDALPLGPSQVGDLVGGEPAASEGPASTDFVSPSLRGTQVDTAGQRPIQLSPDAARQLNDATEPVVQAMIADAVAKRMGVAMDAVDGGVVHDIDGGADQDAVMDAMGNLPATGQEENLPLVDGLPLVGDIVGSGGPLKDFVVVGNFTQGIPVVGDVLSGNLDPSSVTKLPVVRQLLDKGLLSASDTPGLPVVGGIPFVGQALGGLTDQVTSGAVMQQPSLTNLLNKPAAAAPAPAVQQPAANRPSPRPAGQAGATQADKPAQTPIHVGRHRATDRPEVADPELESSSLPLVGSLTGQDRAGVGTLPLSSLMRSVPLVNDVPLVGELGTPLKVLKALPLVGTVTGLIPVESDTAA